jgi:hypothetical protein
MTFIKIYNSTVIKMAKVLILGGGLGRALSRQESSKPSRVLDLKKCSSASNKVIISERQVHVVHKLRSPCFCSLRK